MYANSIHAVLGVSDLAAVKNSFTSDGIFIYKKLLTKIYKIARIISSLTLLIGFIAILIGGINWWKRNRKRKGLSASEYFSNADTSDLTDEELQELNDEKEMMIWMHNYLLMIFVYIDMWC